MSVGFSLIATTVCLLIGYPLAYCMSKTKERTRGLLMILLMLPMWISLLIRTYSLMALLDNGGIVSGFLVSLGFQKLTFIGTEAKLKHFHYDTFVLDGILGELPAGIPAHFHTAEVGGEIDSVALPLVTEQGGALVRFLKK